MSSNEAVNPAHYKGYVEVVEGLNLQWLEVMCRIQRYRDNPQEFMAAVELQVRKYLDRSGRKDAPIQEMEKALWYHKFMVAFAKNGYKPILVKDIDEILAR